MRPMIYSFRDVAVLAYVAGLLSGMIIAFASCSADPDSVHDHITTGAQQ